MKPTSRPRKQWAAAAPRRAIRLRAVALGAALALLSGLASAADDWADDRLADDVLKDRRATIDSMTPDAAAELRHRWNRFRALPSDDQNRLRQFHHDLEGE